MNDRPLTKEEYQAMKGIRILGSKDPPKEVYNSKGELSHLYVYGAKIDFKPMNEKFFPFHMAVLDIKMHAPPSLSFTEHYMFCTKHPFTGMSSEILLTGLPLPLIYPQYSLALSLPRRVPRAGERTQRPAGQRLT